MSAPGEAKDGTSRRRAIAGGRHAGVAPAPLLQRGRMSEPGEAKDAPASRAKPRLEERVCERGWRARLGSVYCHAIATSAPTSQRVRVGGVR
jgi:hypothetical protein